MVLSVGKPGGLRLPVMVPLNSWGTTPCSVLQAMSGFDFTFGNVDATTHQHPLQAPHCSPSPPPPNTHNSQLTDMVLSVGKPGGLRLPVMVPLDSCGTKPASLPGRGSGGGTCRHMLQDSKPESAQQDTGDQGGGTCQYTLHDSK
jgi:hypothetical protein